MIRTQAGKILRSVGYGEVTTFDNGQVAFEALTRVAEQSAAEGKPLTDFIAILLSDIEMPPMDGLTLCRRRIKTELELPLPTTMFLLADKRTNSAQVQTGGGRRLRQQTRDRVPHRDHRQPELIRSPAPRQKTLAPQRR